MLTLRNTPPTLREARDFEATMRAVTFNPEHIITWKRKRLIATLRQHLTVEVESEQIPYYRTCESIEPDGFDEVHRQTTYKWKGRVVDKRAMLAEGIELLP